MPRTDLRFALAVCLLALSGARAPGRDPAPAPAPPPLTDLTPALRARVDRLAGQQPLDSVQQAGMSAAGDVTIWLISNLAMSPEEEAAHADDLDKLIRKHHRASPTPAAAEQVFRKLHKALPAYLAPREFRYTLTVLDLPAPVAFTAGGGQVYVSRRLLDALAPEKPGGAEALAFLLAHQMGHIGLEHCRRGWQAFEIQEEMREGGDIRVTPEGLRKALETGVEFVGGETNFMYTRRQIYEADVFAYQLCQNAGIPVGRALDALRWLALVQEPRIRTEEAVPAEVAPEPDRPTTPPALLRLRRLLMLRDGVVEDPRTYGLFVYDPAAGTLALCGEKSVAADERPVVFVHGMRGTATSFRDYLPAFAARPEMRGRKLLVFRYPNNASLALSGRFLHHQVTRACVAPAGASFVCHSAGGLVFRYYAELMKGGFERAVTLGTPHQGSNLGPLKFVIDVCTAAGTVAEGPGAIARMMPEGLGQVGYDIHPDSLFLRHLGHNAELAKRYHVFSGDYLNRGQVMAWRLVILTAQKFMKNRVVPHIRSKVIARGAERRIDEWHMPREISYGDLVVAVPSALLEDAGRATRTKLNHEEFLTDKKVIGQVCDSILEK